MTVLLGVFGWLAVLVVATMFVMGRRRLRALAWSGRLPWRFGALPVEELESHEAPRGFKCAQLVISPDGGDVRLAGVSVGGSYRVEDDAVCVRGREHDCPSFSCECGFYAFSRPEDAVDLLARRVGYDGDVVVRALLEVDLAGIVIEHDRGFRAEHQRVLGIRVLPWCADCAVDGRLVRAGWLAADGRPALTWTEWGPAAAALRERLHPTVRLLQEWSALRPLCDRCADRTRLVGWVRSLPEVAGRLGTEVRWLDASAVASERVLAGHRPTPRPTR